MNLETVRVWLRASAHMAVLTGAGVSAESGVPIFRDAQTGLWSQFRPEDLATDDAFRAHPERVWDGYVWRRQLVAHALPNAAHQALHGNLFDNHWLDAPKACCDTARAEAGSPPRCGCCGKLLRPGVVWFGEALAAQTATRSGTHQSVL